MPLALPISTTQLWPFVALGAIFFVLVIQAASKRRRESGATSDRRSRFGIILQSFGIGLAGFGPIRPTLPPFSPVALAGTAAVIVLMGGAVALFATSSRALGRNWSLVARTRSDHELIRSGPYAHVRHPIYLGMLLFLLAMAVAFGHWIQLLIALPLFFAGTAIRTKLEDGLLEQRFGDAFRDYRRSTPAIFPRLFKP